MRSDSYNCRDSKNERMRFTGRKRKADWVMDKEKRRNGLEEMRKLGGEWKRETLQSNTVKVRLMPPRGGADIRGRMSSSNVLSLTFFPSLPFLLVFI